MAEYQDITFDTVDRPKPQAIRDRAYTLSLRVYTNGTLENSNITAGTVTITLPGGGALDTAVTNATVTNTSGLLTYQIASGNTGVLGVNYRAHWKITITGANPAVLEFFSFFDVVRMPLWNIVRQDDLTKYHPGITDLLFTGESDYQDTIELAFSDVFEMLEARGKRPHLILDAQSMRKPVVHRALYLIFMARAKNAEDRHSFWAAHHLSEFNRWFASTTFIYDEDQDGHASTSETDAQGGEEGSGGSPRIRL